MANQNVRTAARRHLAATLAPLAALVLAGCVGTSTYGTGKTQEEQLYEDLLGLAAIGGPAEKKQPINYMSRPGLVKPPQTAQLPAPAQSVSEQSGYFPEDPELRRAQLLSDLKEAEATGSDIPAEVAAMRAESAARSRDSSRNANLVGDRQIKPEDHNPELARKQREEMLQKRAEMRGAIGAQPRKYLTEPPAPYRTPKETAAIGQIGEKERNPYERNGETNILDRVFNRK